MFYLRDSEFLKSRDFNPWDSGFLSLGLSKNPWNFYPGDLGFFRDFLSLGYPGIFFLLSKKTFAENLKMFIRI